MKKDIILIDLVANLLDEAFSTLQAAKGNIARVFQFPAAKDMVKVAIGMRRSGKTCFLYQTINELLAGGVTKEQILLINFEDDRLLPMTAEEMGQLIDAFYSLYPKNHHRRCYLFFDEVQNVQDWFLVVRRYLDKKDVQIYLTGSSAKLLSKEINTSLRGRSLAVEVLPYSFSEYLTAQNTAMPQKPFGQAAFDVLQQHLLQYFSRGGFPAVQTMEKNEWRETLQSYVDTVIFRDIIERHNVTNISLLKYLLMSLLKNVSAPFSINKFYNDIKSQGYKVGKETIHNYLDYIQDAFLIFVVPFYSESMRLKQNRPKKIYAVDTGLVNAISLNLTNEYGKWLENLVYLDLRRQKKSIYFYTTKEGYEVDFVTIDAEGNKELIQVVWDMSNENTLAREQRSLECAIKELNIPGRIVTSKDYLRDWLI